MLDLKTDVNSLLTLDHSELDEMLEKLFIAFEMENVEQVYRWLDLFWARLAMHIRAEHLHLFPAILQAFESSPKSKKEKVTSLATAKETITFLQLDHKFFMREFLSTIKRMRDLRESIQKDRTKELKKVCAKIITIQNRLEKHNKLEEIEVYRWADILLQTAECSDLIEKMKKEITNLPSRFKENQS